jgi:outer membrane protein OmpA-like peptidoglycan-associated protein
MTPAAGTAACVPRSPGAFLKLMLRCAVALVVGMLGVSASARAQVTVDLHALDALPRSATAPRPAHRPPVRRPTRSATRQNQPTPQAQTPSEAAAATPPSVAATPPPAAIALPAPAPPVAPAPPPTATAPVAALPVAPPPPSPAVAPSMRRTLHVAFAPGQSDLAAAEAGAVAQLGRDAPRTDATRVEVLAFAPATGGDASAARRLSLARALAIRSALVGAGVPSASIIVRALGSPPADQAGAVDAAVVTVVGASDTAAAPKQGKQP